MGGPQVTTALTQTAGIPAARPTSQMPPVSRSLKAGVLGQALLIEPLISVRPGIRAGQPNESTSLDLPES